MLELIVLVVAVSALGASLVLARLLIHVDSRLKSTEQMLASGARQALPGTGHDSFEPHPLEGLKIAVAINQDHKQAVFADLLKELLLSEDVAEVTMLRPAEAKGLEACWTEG